MPDDAIQIRQSGLLDRLDAAGFNALVLNPGPSLTYLTGLHFHLSERPVVAVFRPEGIPVIVLPELEAGKVRDLPFEIRSFTYSEDPASWALAFTAAAAEARLDYRRIGVEPTRLRLLEHRLIEEAAPRAAFLGAESVLAALRSTKDASELDRMRQAVEVAERALTRALESIRPGMTEKALAREITVNLLRNGSAPELPFSPIVAFGSATANPHAVPSDRILREGDLGLIDWGASVDGYFSDLTRMFSVGELDDELREIVTAVRDANAAARRAAGPGVPASEVDRAARGVIEAAGYGKYFIHRTGHGLGLEVHEEPYIRADNTDLLRVGMTFTVEPGIYIPGLGGVRIEDDVVIVDDGSESLSQATREVIDIQRLTSVGSDV